MVIYFDLDDTLYRLYDPFYKAYQKVFHEDLDIYALWKQVESIVMKFTQNI